MMHKETSKKYAKKKQDILSYLPGKNTNRSIKNEMIRVDHAGEFGAVHIYRGQLDALKHHQKFSKTVEQIKEMQAQEKIHLAKFNDVLPERQIRPSLLSPVWQVGGYMMGAITGIISPKSAMACTEAVETVIDQHYEKQINYFENAHKADDLLTDLKKFQQDERDHKHEAINSDAEQAPLYGTTKRFIEMLCYVVIKLAHKF